MPQRLRCIDDRLPPREAVEILGGLVRCDQIRIFGPHIEQVCVMGLWRDVTAGIGNDYRDEAIAH